MNHLIEALEKIAKEDAEGRGYYAGIAKKALADGRLAGARFVIKECEDGWEVRHMHAMYLFPVSMHVALAMAKAANEATEEEARNGNP